MYYKVIMRWKKKQKFLKPLWNTQYNYAWDKQKMYERNAIETIVYNDRTLLLEWKKI